MTYYDGTVLRARRQAAGWDVPELARRARRVAAAIGIDIPDSTTLCRQIRRWEAGGTISERYCLIFTRTFSAIPTSTANVLDPDEQDRLAFAAGNPARADTYVVDDLRAILAAQRHLEDAIGPGAVLVPVGAQLRTVESLARGARGPLRSVLTGLTAEWLAFTGWLNAAIRRDDAALALFALAEEAADEAADGTIAAVATSFRGYVARQQGRPRAVVRASAAAMATPGDHPTQRCFDMLQAAQGYAAMGDQTAAVRSLEQAEAMIDHVGEPPVPIYWYTPPFYRLNIGMALVGLGRHSDAAALMTEAFGGLPADQQRAEWLEEYRAALDEAHTPA